MQRRDFLLGNLGVLSLAATRLGARAGARPAAPRIRIGYAAITWGGNDAQAIDDIASVGFRGIQLRASAVARWAARPGELKDLLAERRLKMVALSSGVIGPGASIEDAVAPHVRNARFVRDVGGLYLQVTDARPRDRVPVADDYRQMGRLLTELGRRTADIGVPLGLHNHMGNLSQSPEEVAWVLDAADPRYVKLELDIAHYHQAGGKPAEAVRAFAGRILFLHIKDVESPTPGGAPSSYRFVELGKGQVDVPAVFSALREVEFDGWAIVELDSVPDDARTPKESANIARSYIERLGIPLDVEG